MVLDKVSSPLPEPMWVIVPTLLIAPVLKVKVPVPAPELMVKLLLPEIAPWKITFILLPVLPTVSVPTEALVASTIGRTIVKAVETSSVAVAEPVVFPSVMFPPFPTDCALVLATKVPALIVVPPV